MMPNTEQRELRAYIHRERYSTEQGTGVKLRNHGNKQRMRTQANRNRYK